MYLVKMPRLGITMTAGKVANWLIREGGSVKVGENLFEMESDKSLVEIEAQADGVLRRILVPQDQEVEVNTVIAVIADADEDVDFDAISMRGDEGGSDMATSIMFDVAVVDAPARPASPAVAPRLRKLAQELGVDLATIPYSGPSITEGDIRRHADAGRAGQDEVIDLTPMQRATSDHLAKTWATVPHFTQIVGVDMTRVLAAKSAADTVGLNELLIKAIGDTAACHPFINGRLNNGHLVKSRTANVSVAMTTPKGLIVPVIEAVERKSLAEISAELRSMISQAKSGDTAQLKTAGGTITFSNLGSYGVETGTPVINAPQSALVFAGAIIRKPVVRGDEIVIAPIMKLSVCFDHRLIEGAVAAAFTIDLKKRLEEL